MEIRESLKNPTTVFIHLLFSAIDLQGITSQSGSISITLVELSDLEIYREPLHRGKQERGLFP